MIYRAEFAFRDTTDLASELIINAQSADDAQTVAENHARNWGLELFSIRPTTQHQCWPISSSQEWLTDGLRVQSSSALACGQPAMADK